MDTMAFYPSASQLLTRLVDAILRSEIPRTGQDINLWRFGGPIINATRQGDTICLKNGSDEGISQPVLELVYDQQLDNYRWREVKKSYEIISRWLEEQEQ